MLSATVSCSNLRGAYEEKLVESHMCIAFAVPHHRALGSEPLLVEATALSDTPFAHEAPEKHSRKALWREGSGGGNGWMPSLDYRTRSCRSTASLGGVGRPGEVNQSSSLGSTNQSILTGTLQLSKQNLLPTRTGPTLEQAFKDLYIN